MWPHCGAQDGLPVFSLQEGISALTAGAGPPSTLLLEQLWLSKLSVFVWKEVSPPHSFLLKKNQDEFKTETLDINRWKKKELDNFQGSQKIFFCIFKIILCSQLLWINYK